MPAYQSRVKTTNTTTSSRLICPHISPEGSQLGGWPRKWLFHRHRLNRLVYAMLVKQSLLRILSCICTQNMSLIIYQADSHVHVARYWPQYYFYWWINTTNTFNPLLTGMGWNRRASSRRRMIVNIRGSVLPLSGQLSVVAGGVCALTTVDFRVVFSEKNLHFYRNRIYYMNGPRRLASEKHKRRDT